MKTIPRPPIVAVLGHVDHGKTTLLDFIRKSNIAVSEHGGITQHIGAYQMTVPLEPSSRATKRSRGIPSENKTEILRQAQDDFAQERKITFIDTPGHEAFAKMRSRGAAVADIALLVVAADDSVKPQTIDSIRQIKAAGVSPIVVINKIDLPGANVEKVKSDLAKHEVSVEGFGGDIPVALVSAKQGNGVPELLDLILLVAQMKGLVGEPISPLEAIVIETKLDKFRGMVATLIVKKGTLVVGADLYDGAISVGRVRAMVDEHGAQVKEALPSKAVEVLGFSKFPHVGAVITTEPQQAVVQKVVVKQATPTIEADLIAAMAQSDKKKIKIILKADTAGSAEAIGESLPKEGIDILRTELGEISEADIMDAKASGAIVVGFNLKLSNAIEKLARVEKVIVRTYRIIYEFIKELTEAAEGLEEVLVTERELGQGVIIAEFPYEDTRIAGTKVTSGRLAKGDSVRIMRADMEVARAKIKSMRKGRDDVTKAEAGSECGVLFDKKVDFILQDAIIAVTIG